MLLALDCELSHARKVERGDLHGGRHAPPLPTLTGVSHTSATALPVIVSIPRWERTTLERGAR